MNKIINKKNKKKGFTLVELIAVIAILGILAAIAVPRIGGLTDGAKTKAAKADARTILTQVEVYNAEADKAKQIPSTAALSTITQTSTTYDSNLQSYKDLYKVVNQVTTKSGTQIPDTKTLDQLLTSVGTN